METIYGSNNWKLTFQRGDVGVTVLRALTCDADAALPETVAGEPVVALGARALAPNAPEVRGEELTVVGAPCAGEWDNRALRALTLPPMLQTVGDYALMNCRTLKTVRLTDRPVAWGVGVLMNCRALDTVRVTRMGGEAGHAVAYFSGELAGELDLAIVSGGRTAARLIFPEYREEYEENSPAHHFDYKVYGAGQPYHNIFRSRVLRYSDYDGLWGPLLSGEYDESAALRLAWWRVCCPEGLSAGAAEQYAAYLSAHAGEALSYVLTLEDTELLSVLLDRIDCTPEALRAAAEQARESRSTAATALLLERLHRFSPAQKSFEI